MMEKGVTLIFKRCGRHLRSNLLYDIEPILLVGSQVGKKAIIKFVSKFFGDDLSALFSILPYCEVDYIDTAEILPALSIDRPWER